MKISAGRRLLASFPQSSGTNLMNFERLAFPFTLLMIVGLFILTGFAAASSPALLPTPTGTPAPALIGRVATPEELAKAQAEWSKSRHANTYDKGAGANTTCASCKSPANWDPQNLAVDSAHDCLSCKRIPGAPRPDLPGGVAVPQNEWNSITCNICHVPVGDSYSTSIAFWNQATQSYDAVSSVTELCGKCHEGQHGFQVVEEQAASTAHKGWECTRCHGAHGAPAKCTDCHDPTQGKGAADHLRHPQVNCTACHDAGGLSIWQDAISTSKHLGQYVTIRFGHALRSWPSHDLQRSVDCKRCHHPLDSVTAAIAAKTDCKACHTDGAVLNWCPRFTRDADPTLLLTPTP